MTCPLAKKEGNVQYVLSESCFGLESECAEKEKKTYNEAARCWIKQGLRTRDKRSIKITEVT